MAKRASTSGARARRSTSAEPSAEGTGGFWRLVGNSESINGMPNGLLGIGLALAAALFVYPVSRGIRAILRR